MSNIFLKHIVTIICLIALNACGNKNNNMQQFNMESPFAAGNQFDTIPNTMTKPQNMENPAPQKVANSQSYNNYYNNYYPYKTNVNPYQSFSERPVQNTAPKAYEVYKERRYPKENLTAFSISKDIRKQQFANDASYALASPKEDFPEIAADPEIKYIRKNYEKDTNYLSDTAKEKFGLLEGDYFSLGYDKDLSSTLNKGFNPQISPNDNRNILMDNIDNKILDGMINDDPLYNGFKTNTIPSL